MGVRAAYARTHSGNPAVKPRERERRRRAKHKWQKQKHCENVVADAERRLRGVSPPYVRSGRFRNSVYWTDK